MIAIPEDDKVLELCGVMLHLRFLAFWADVRCGASRPDFFYRCGADWTRLPRLVSYLKVFSPKVAFLAVKVLFVGESSFFDAAVKDSFDCIIEFVDFLF